ncbi:MULTISPECIES: hypothetical protein [unclassified Agarivorans]|nr:MULTISPECIES: hypothetical protein [unclassified Agarivorans]MDO6685367.1 hypothetical protein [Agarivorans sp. 3_MG-2023]MDO6715461.1 hypothetical protein [Agarivorans sp. 2_MG-2023]
MMLLNTIKENKVQIYSLTVFWSIGILLSLILFPSTPRYLSSLLGLLIATLFFLRLKKYNTIFFIKALIRKLGLAPIVGFLIYASWCFIVLIYIKEASSGVGYLDHIIQEFGEPSEFIKSYASSAIDSLVFFVLVGLVLTVRSIKQPEDERLSRKVEHIFPTVQTESILSKHLIDKVSELACINETTERIVSICDYSESDGFVKISIKSHSVIKNIHNNCSFSHPNMPWGFSVEESKPNTEILGEIHEISIISKLTGNSKEKHLLSGIAQLTADENSYNTTHSIDIPAEKEVLYQTNVWAWEHINKKWTFNSSRYTESRRFSLFNHTEIDFQVDVELSNGETSQIVLEAKKKDGITPKEIIHKELLPDDSISFRLSKVTGSAKGSVNREEASSDENTQTEDEKYV